MKGRSKGISFEIEGDELEQHRMQLERNLQNTELSFHISSASDDEHNNHDLPSRRRRQPHPHHSFRQNDSSVEYPRHLSEPSMPDFPSFAQRSRDHFGDEEQSHMHAWSYRTGDEEEGINPYGGETMSTVAHHASVVTLSAGLGGGRTARHRDPSLSGAEYDPDRPLHAMIAGVTSKHSMLDMDPSRSKNAVMNSMTQDPIVVDSTAELDRLLESGHAPPPMSSAGSRSVRLTSPIPSSGTSSDSEQNQSSRLRLTDHLRHVSFSPKRPRSAQGNLSSPASPFSQQDLNNASMNMATPRPTRRTNIFPSYSSPVQPEVRLQPATPSTTGSKFTRMARGINKEIEATQQQIASTKHASTPNRPASAPVERNPFHETVPESSFRNPTPRKSSMKDTTRSRIHLPDVTGLTNAVESPLKPETQYYPYKAGDRPRDSEARLLQTLSTVQAQLHDLEDENSISRRRVRELEMELEECKREVARERTRLIEREELNSRIGPDVSYRAGGSRGKGKSKVRDLSGVMELDDERLHARYKEAVDEKKALEALINSLRSHLTRLTSELASHQELLTELRTLREQDARALREKSTEITQLKEEVQRLAGEVEVLRGVVEEGLKERRASRENIQMETSEADLGMSQDLQEEPQSEDERQPGQDEDEEDKDDLTYHTESSMEEVTEEPEPFDPASYQAAADKTMRTDHATLGSTELGQSTNSPNNGGANPAGTRFVDDEELNRIAAEVEERRSNRSNESIISQRRRPGSPSSPIRHNVSGRRATIEEVHEEVPGPRSTRQAPRTAPTHIEQSISRPAAPTPRQAACNRDIYDRDEEPETPFPQIRGEHLERLFFSAPEHNAKTCTVCYRRQNRPHEDASHSWSRPRAANGQSRPQHQHTEQDVDEGYEGSEGADERGAASGAAIGNKGKQREYITFSQDPAHWRQIGKKQGLPPQAVVSRVVRELEDDFTHYKSVYVELADQYKVMDAASDVRRRNLLAKHLREVVDVLEQKGDQIASLYDLLSFKDRSNFEPAVPDNTRPVGTWGEGDRRRGVS